MKSHLANGRKTAVLTQVSIIGSERFNKSATLDIETSLIQYVGAEGTYQLLNGNYGQRRHHYYEQNIYKHLFKEIWDKLRGRNIVRKSLADIENSQVFKYSPLKSLTEDQHSSVLEASTALSLTSGLTKRESNRIFVEGGADTGKTILATFLVKLLSSEVGFDRHSHQISRPLRLRRELSRTSVVRVAPELVEGGGGHEIVTKNVEKRFQEDSRPGGLHGDKTFRDLQKGKIRSVDRGRGPSAAPVPEHQLGRNVP